MDNDSDGPRETSVQPLQHEGTLDNSATAFQPAATQTKQPTVISPLSSMT